jgi:hypothetical protein
MVPSNKPFNWLYGSCIGLIGAGAAIAATQHNLDGYKVGSAALVIGLAGLAYDTRRRPKEPQDT